MSPLRSSAGPATCRMPTPSSLRTICASDVLPSPGGPASRTWSSASPRAFAASSAIASCSLTRSWPTKSASVRGRSDRSSSSSASAEHGREELRSRRLPAARARTCSSTGSSGSTSASARSASTSVQPSSTSASRAVRSPPRRAPASTTRELLLQLEHDALRRLAGRCRGSPGSASTSSRAIARRSSAGVEPETIASATFGPTPETPSSSSNSSRSSAVAKP